MSEPSNLGQALQEEIKRNQKLLFNYREIGPIGTFAFTMISRDVDDAIKALAESDTVEMIRIYETLKNNK